MKKALITIAIGDSAQRLEAQCRENRMGYAAKFGWDYRVLRELPAAFISKWADRPVFWQVNTYKLHLPEALKDENLVAYIDNDTLFGPAAPDLETDSSGIPAGGFAAARTFDFEERLMIDPNWQQDYYVDLEENRGLRDSVADRTLAINGGLLLFRPSDVLDRWRELADMDTELNEENRLNVYEVQEGRCHLLDSRWNVVWRYEKYRRGHLRWRGTLLGRAQNRLYNRYLPFLERRHLREALRRSFLLHAAFEHEKLYLLEHGGVGQA